MALQAAMSSSYMAWASARIFSWIWVEGCAGGQQVREQPLHAVDGPEEIDRGGPGSGQARADALELGGELGSRRGRGLHCAQGDAVGGGDADSRRAADDHGDDDLGHLLIGGGEYIALLEWELGLVDKTDALRGPGEGGNHAIPV